MSGVSGACDLVMVSGASSGVASKVSSAVQVVPPSVQVVPGLVVTVPTLWTLTGTSLARMVTVMAKTTLPPLGATVIATPAGDPVPVGVPHVEVAPVGVQVQVAPAASRGGSGSGSEKVPDPVAPVDGLVMVTV